MSLPFDFFRGENIADIIEDKSAVRIGARIKKIREAREMTRAELGSLVGLDKNRVQQYENGWRKPKIPLLKKIAAALGVETIALMDPTTDSYIGVMHTLFQLEESFDLKLIKKDGCLYLQFGDGRVDGMNHYLSRWYDIRQNLEKASSDLSPADQRKMIFDYNMFEWTYPSGISKSSGKKYDEHPINRIQELEESKERLKDIMKEIDNEGIEDNT
ncbi:MAG: helix-turn-helix transcriptional regulator [Butyrivibrio sp.]|nr:helix-turn-helix transcriptional regulator [Butyrivibrio sp.]